MKPGAAPTDVIPTSASEFTTLTPSGIQSIKVRHNVEMAHRLSLLPGKCQQIHGHSWWIELEMIGSPNGDGIIREFGEVKKEFRNYLDWEYDHKLLLNSNDEWASENVGTEGTYQPLPGVQYVEADPTTENIARWIGLWAQDTFGSDLRYKVTVWETATNCATWASLSTARSIPL